MNFVRGPAIEPVGLRKQSLTGRIRTDMPKLHAFLVAFALCVLIFPVRAESARLLPFHGMIAGAGGKAVRDGEHLVQFQIYGEPSGGTPIWAGETHRLSVTSSSVNVLLGSKNPLPVDRPDTPSRSFFDTELYLQITVDTDNNGVINHADVPMLPRQAVVPVVFAQDSANSRKLAGYDWTPLFGVNNPTGQLSGNKIAAGSLPASTLLPGSLTSVQLATNSVTAEKLAPGMIPFLTSWETTSVKVLWPAEAGIASAKMRRVGENAEFVVEVVFQGDVDAAIWAAQGLEIELPFQIDPSKQLSTRRRAVGSWIARSLNGALLGGTCITHPAGAGGNRVIAALNNLNVVRVRPTEGNDSTVIVEQISPVTFTSTTEFSMQFSIPILGWSVAR